MNTLTSPLPGPGTTSLGRIAAAAPQHSTWVPAAIGILLLIIILFVALARMMLRALTVFSTLLSSATIAVGGMVAVLTLGTIVLAAVSIAGSH